MKISTKGRYALRIMIDLAEQKNQLTPIKDIAQRQEISIKYLEQIVSMLFKKNLVEGFRGPTGGYKLTKSPDKINVAEILEATEGPIAIVECLEKNNTCKREKICKSKNCWNKLNFLISDYLKSVTLQDIL